jgi:peptide/nickel transport system substrate-binding protein
MSLLLPSRPSELSQSFTRRQILQCTGATLAASGVLSAARVNAQSVPRILTTTKLLSAPESTLTIALNRSLTDLDPHSAYDTGSTIALHGQFETLIQVQPDTTDRFVPLIAHSWDANEDNSVWTFHLNDGVIFQDGTPCDAEAVKLSFERELALGLTPATVIKRFIQEAAKISTPDARTVVFDLGRPQPRFDAAISAPAGAPIVNAKMARQHDVNGDWGHAWAQTANDGLGTGPYRLAENDSAEKAVLARYNEYWRGWEGPHFETVNLRYVSEAETRRELIEQGDADIADNISPEELSALLANPDLNVNLSNDLTVVYIMLAVTGPLQSPSARQGICYAFPYDAVVSGVYEGYAKRAIGPCAELCKGFDANTFVYKTDLDQSKALFDQAGVPSGTTLKMLVPASAPWAGSIAELLRANLERIGLKLETQLADYATLVATYYGDMPIEDRPHLMPTFWYPDYNDGWNHLWPQVSSAAWKFGNAGHYANPKVDALLDKARDATNEESYQSALSQVQQIVTRDDPAAIYVVQPEWPVVLRKEIGGFVPNLVSAGLYGFYQLYRQQN